VNVIRSSNSGIDRIALDDGREGERFPLFPLLPNRGRERSCRVSGRAARRAATRRHLDLEPAHPFRRASRSFAVVIAAVSPMNLQTSHKRFAQ
jgi:hypothetical protein